MESHNSWTVSSNAASPRDESLQDSTIPNRVLQEQSGNRRHDSICDASRSWRREPPSPLESAYPHEVGNYFTGSLATQFSSQTSEEHVNRETSKLWRLLERSDKYQKYRERQPTNPNTKPSKEQEEQKWPDHLEFAFFKGLVRWQPMGRRKLMLNGRLRGRNELIVDSIEKDTGIQRTRKQVSSHIQVLKNILSDQPAILHYMSKEDLGAKKPRHYADCLRSRHGISQPPIPNPKHGYSSHNGQNDWQMNGLSAQLPMPTNPISFSQEPETTFTMSYFEMFVQDSEKKPLHKFTQLSDNPRLDDIHVHDTQTWNQQHPELSFLGTKDWSNSQVLFCDASLQIMSEKLPQHSELAVQCGITSQTDLAIFDRLECRTRFYDKGELAYQFEDGRPVKETSCNCDYDPSSWRVSIFFGSNFWARRMSLLGKHFRDARLMDEQSKRVKIDLEIRRNLKSLTAVQEVYGTKRSSGQAQCLLTILWRFHQTTPHEEPGTATWRVVKFIPPAPLRWVKVDNPERKKELKPPDETQLPLTTIYPTLPLDFSHQHLPQHLPQLDLEGLSTITALESMNNFPHPSAAPAPSLVTDLSTTHSLPSLTHSHDSGYLHPQEFDHTNDVDFTGGHINISLEPTVNLGAYEDYHHPQSSANPLGPLVGLEHSAMSSNLGDLGLGASMATYGPKPWAYPDPIPKIDGMGEPIEIYDNHGAHQHDNIGNGILHGPVEHGPWKLQSPFPDDTGVGADPKTKDESMSQEHENWLMALVEKDRKEREERCRVW